MGQDNLRVLLIEHDSGFARYLGEMLAQARDFTADAVRAPTLEEGLTALAQGNFDVLVLDLSVPDGAGMGNRFIGAR